MRKVLYLESQAEELFLDLFSDVFGPDKASLLYPQYGSLWTSTTILVSLTL